MAIFSPPLFLTNGHLQTVLPLTFRNTLFENYDERIRCVLSDSDFIDIDMKYSSGSSLVFILHGLESNSHSTLVKNTAYKLTQHGFNVAAINFRGCSGPPNTRLQSYHSGATQDIHEVLTFLSQEKKWDSLFGIGFSLGGNVLLRLNYELNTHKYEYSLQKCVAVSVPLDLETCAFELNKVSNYVYMARFVRMYRKKLTVKKDLIDSSGLNYADLLKVHSFYEIDEKYTAPAHGYLNAQDYWNSCSALPILEKIITPTLLINAKDDPFLSSLCFPIIDNPQVQTIYPNHGGHLGFIDSLLKPSHWLEQEIFSFFQG